MTFTYSDDLMTDINFVRFHTGDTVEAESFLSDGIITSLVATEGTKEKAVIAGLEHIILRLSDPNFKADWLQIDNESARKGKEIALAAKKTKFGLNTLVGGVVNTYRADSGQTEEPDYSEGRP